MQPFPLDPGLVHTTWDLGCWRGLRRTSRGSSNLTYFVETDGGEFVLRISNPGKTVQSIRWEVSLLGHLAGRGFPVPRVSSAVLFDSDRLSAVLDFERSAEARVLDFADMARGFTRSATDESLDIDRLALLIDAYRRQEAFPEAEALPLALRAQRLLRVRRKAANFLARHEGEEPHPRDGLKLLRIIETEAARINWLEQHHGAIVTAVAS